MVMAQGRRLGADDWASAALSALGEVGLAGVAIEPLAARLGTTKGSFYWHFANRDALVAATLKLWERSHTEAIIAAVDREPDPARRLRALFRSISPSAARPTSRAADVEVNLLATADHPLVAPVMARVVERRLSYLREIFLELGLPADEASRRSLLAYASYLGTAQLSQRLPAALPQDDSQHQAHLDSVVQLLLTSPS